MNPSNSRAPRAVAFIAALSLAACASRSAPPAETPASIAARTPTSAAPAPRTQEQAATAQAVAASGPDNAYSDTADNSAWRDRGWVFVAVGSAAGVVALGTGLLMLTNMSTRSSNCSDAKVCNADGYNANTQIGNLGGVNAAAFGIAAVGIGVGAFLVLSHPLKRGEEKTTEPKAKNAATRDSRDTTSGSTALGISPTGSGIGLNLKGSF